MSKLNPLSALSILVILVLIVFFVNVNLFSVLPILAILGTIFYLVRRNRRGGGGGIMRTGASGTIDRIQSFPQEGQRITNQSSAKAMSAPLGTLEQRILERVKAGDYRISVRAMADELGVSQAEIRAALEQLRERGLIQL